MYFRCYDSYKNNIRQKYEKIALQQGGFQHVQ